MSDPRIVVALDYPDADSALGLAHRLNPEHCRVKVGKELFTRAGPAVVEALQACGFQVFLDLKYHDIPNTVAGACRAAAELGVWMLNVHALGGSRMMAAAREAVSVTSRPPLLVAVTVLTSMTRADLEEIGMTSEPLDAVLNLATLAQGAGLDGVVCSPRELPELRAKLPEGFRFVTPGIRLAGGVADDQRRVMTPDEAIRLGASYLVIGRPITGAPDPAEALEAIHARLRDAGA